MVLYQRRNVALIMLCCGTNCTSITGTTGREERASHKRVPCALTNIVTGSSSSILWPKALCFQLSLPGKCVPLAASTMV